MLPDHRAVGASLNADPAIDLGLVVRDRDVLEYLNRFAEGDQRDRAALAALRVGVLAIMQAGGTVDAQAVRNEGERLIAGVKTELEKHAAAISSDLGSSLRQYLDPKDGQLPLKLNEMIKPNGQLDQLLTRHVGLDNSTLAGSLAKQVGEASPLVRSLDPRQKDGLVETLKVAIQQSLDAQRDHVVRQFSVTDPQSALSIFRDQLTKANGQLRDELSKDVIRVQREFDLGNNDGALARLVTRVEDAQKKITGEFTLDNTTSALSRLKGEIVGLLEQLRDRNTEFQRDVKAAVDSLRAVRGERDKTTAGGQDFEAALNELLQAESSRLGDEFEACGTFPGDIPRCKTGDAVITLGAETAASGRRIVFEAKREAKSLTQAREELAEARKNRRADIGIFVFSAMSAAGLEPFSRHGDDLVVVWNHDDRATDVYIKAAISVARALVVRRKIEQDSAKVDLTPVQEALDALIKSTEAVQDMTRLSGLAMENNRKISDRADRMKKDLEVTAERLSACLTRLRAAAGG
jgi:hypothetical protein